MKNSSEDGFNISWFAHHFGVGRRTISKRLKTVEINPAYKEANASYYRVVDVAPLLLPSSELGRPPLLMEARQLTTSINRLSGILLRAIDQD